MSIKTAGADVPFNIEIAQKPEQLERGLMFRKSLPADYAMLFLFDTDEPHVMWMKNTLVSLDMLFVDKNGKIVYIQTNTTPQSLKHIESPEPVASRAVIEMPAGTVASKHIQTGDKVIHPYFMQ